MGSTGQRCDAIDTGFTVLQAARSKAKKHSGDAEKAAEKSPLELFAEMLAVHVNWRDLPHGHPTAGLQSP